MIKSISIWTLCLGLLVFSCSKREDTASYPVLGIDAIEDVFFMKDQSEALIRWANRGIKDAILVHVDAYDSLEFIPSEKIERLRGLTKKKKWKWFNESRGVLFKNRNYIYAAVQLGIVKEIYWVLPYRFFDDIPLAGEKIKNFLRTEGSMFKNSEINDMEMDFGCLTGRLSGADIHICSPRTLPTIEVPVIMSIDASFFPVYASEYRISKLRALKWFFDKMSFRQMRIVHADISYSIEGGYTKPIHRYIGDELLEGIGNPQIFKAESPPELWRFRDMAENMLSGGEGKLVVEYLTEPLKKYPDDLSLRLLNAAARLFTGKYDDAFKDVDKLCIRDVHYCYSFIYLGNILKDKQKHDYAERFFLKALETLPGSRYAAKQYMIFLKESGQQEKADIVHERFNVDVKTR